MKTIPAYRGELGLEIYFRVPVVYAMGKREPIAVEIEEGKEALYRSAAEHIIVEREPETTEAASRKRGGVGRPKISGPAERFVPEPHATLGLLANLDEAGISLWDPDPWGCVPEVVVCPRWRGYGETKNWGEWPKLTAMLQDAGMCVGAAGAPDSSADVPCLKAWELAYHERFLDASILLIRSTRLVIATDAGLAHLAVLCGASLLLVTYRGLVAPGPVINSSGRKARDSYWRAGYDPAERINRFEDANHTGAPIEYVDGWEDPKRVVEAAEEMIG